ncbi:transglutaminase-like domain-containing protein [Patescibacteria group bacterium]|nr:transglutaminase-like domain-containing protein [Patescibacteria group bacterium]
MRQYYDLYGITHMVEENKNQNYSDRNKSKEYMDRPARSGLEFGRFEPKSLLENKDRAIEEGIDIFQRENRLQEDIFSAYKQGNISESDFINLTERVFEHDAYGGLKLLKNVKEKDLKRHNLIDIFTPQSINKHDKLAEEIKKQIRKKFPKPNDSVAGMLLRDIGWIEKEKLEKAEKFWPLSDERGRSFGNQKAKELWTKIETHYADYLLLKKIKALDYADPRSAAESLGENSLAEFFAPETTPQKIKYDVGVNIRSRDKARAKWLKRFRTLLDATLNDPELTWREKQQEFAREISMDELQKEITESLDKRNTGGKLGCDQDKKEYLIKKDGIELTSEKITEGNIITKTLPYQEVTSGYNFLYSTGGGFTVVSEPEQAKKQYFKSVSADGIVSGPITDFGRHNPKLMIDKFSAGKMDRDDLEVRKMVVEQGFENSWNNNLNYLRMTDYLELFNPVKILSAEKTDEIQIYKEDRNQANLLLVGFDGQKKNMYCEGKGVTVENIQVTYGSGSFIDGSWARFIKLVNGQWAIYHDRNNPQECLTTIPDGCLPVSNIYQPLDRKLFTVHQLDSNGKALFSVIMDEDGNAISEKHNFIDFQGEYIYQEMIYLAKSNPYCSGPEEIWSESSGLLVSEDCPIKKIWGMQDRIYWVNDRNKFKCRYRDQGAKITNTITTLKSDNEINFIMRFTKNGVNDRIVYPTNLKNELVLGVIDGRGNWDKLDSSGLYKEIVKMESVGEKCLVVHRENKKLKIFLEGLGDVGGEWDKIYFLKERGNELLICGRRGDEILEVAVDLDLKPGLTNEEMTKLKLLNLIKQYDLLVYEEGIFKKKGRDTYSQQGKDKLAAKEAELKAKREELKTKILEYFDNDSAAKEMWEKYDPEKGHRQYSPKFADKIAEIVKASPELFLDFFRAKKDKNLEKLAGDIIDQIFQDALTEKEQEPAKKDHWVKGLAKNIVSKIFGGTGESNVVERFNRWMKAKPEYQKHKPKLTDFFRTNSQAKRQVLGGNPREGGKGLELMRWDKHYQGFLCNSLLGKCDDGKNWEYIDFPVEIKLQEPVREITTTMSVVKTWNQVDLPKPINAEIIPTRIKGITMNNQEINLASHINQTGQVTAIMDPNKPIKKITYSWQESKEEEIADIKQSDYDTFRNNWSREHAKDLLVNISPNLDERYEQFLALINNLSPKQKVISIEEFIKKIGYYDMDNVETLAQKDNKTFDEKLLLMEERLDFLKKNNSQLTGKLGDKYIAGVCADYALLTVALLRKAGFMAGYASGVDANGQTATSKDAHAKAFVLWPDEEGKAIIHTVDSTPGGIDEKQQEEIAEHLHIETITEKEKRLEEEKDKYVNAVSQQVKTWQDLTAEELAKIDNGVLEQTLNEYLSSRVKQSHVKSLRRMLEAYWYSPTHKADISDKELKREIGLFLANQIRAKKEKLAIEDKKIGAGKDMMEMVIDFADKFRRDNDNLSEAEALDKVKQITAAVPEGLLTRVEVEIIGLITKYLQGNRMIRR